MNSNLTMQLMGEFFGTIILVLLGDGVCAGVNLKKSKAEGSGWVAISFGWGFAVTFGVFCVSWLCP
ncbi:MAG: aquaporin, partial [Lactobacillus sp.]|nr:aquaporin [Lactobacillus sp.]